MPITREQLLASLHTDWDTFVERFQRVSPQAQAAYLQQQGYARFADLLAHVIAQWQEGLAAIPVMLSNPAYTLPDQDVDHFNAQAVARLYALMNPPFALSLPTYHNNGLGSSMIYPLKRFKKRRSLIACTLRSLATMPSTASRKSSAAD